MFKSLSGYKKKKKKKKEREKKERVKNSLMSLLAGSELLN